MQNGVACSDLIADYLQRAAYRLAVCRVTRFMEIDPHT
jgi:hypothetical protein